MKLPLLLLSLALCCASLLADDGSSSSLADATIEETTKSPLTTADSTSSTAAPTSASTEPSTSVPTTEKPTSPTEIPTSPTDKPTTPTDKPTSPTDKPTSPTDEPTEKTTSPTEKPTTPTDKPTEKPTAPTDKPTITPTIRPNTTVEPNTTTSSHPTTSSPPTSTAGPTPAPKINNYVLKDGNITCARLQLNISAKIPYDEANKTTGVYELNPGTDMVMMPSSTCNGPNNTEVIHLLVAGKHHLNIVLLKNKDKVSLSLELHYSQKDMENATNPDDEYSVISKDIWSVPASRSYQCNSEVSVTLSPELNITGAHEVVAKLWDVRYMAYVNQTTDNYNQEWPCDQDTQMADIVPIAVGVALAALVVVVVIAYTVSRRRTKQRGYQSV